MIDQSNSLGYVSRCAVLICVCCGLSTIGTAAPNAIVQDPIYDVGTVYKGHDITHSFSIRNGGDTPLHLVEVRSSCGCTVLQYDEVIEPGSIGRVEATLDTSNLSGPIAKSLTVLTNDPNNPKLNLVVKANVKVRVTAQPNYARFMSVFGQGERHTTITVSSSEMRNFRIEDVQSPYPFLKVEYRREPSAEDVQSDTWLVEMTLASEPPVGPLADFVVIKTNHPFKPELKIPVSGFVRPVLAVSPRIADFGNVELLRSQMTSLEVRNLGGDEISLHDVQIDLQGVRGDIEAIEEGKVYKISLTLDPGMPKGAFKGTLKIRTSSPLQPVVEVELRGRVL